MTGEVVVYVGGDCSAWCVIGDMAVVVKGEIVVRWSNRRVGCIGVV